MWNEQFNFRRFLAACGLLALASAPLLLKKLGVITAEDSADIGALTTGIVGAYFGASASIWYQARKENVERRQKAAEAANALLFAMFQRWELLRTLREIQIAPYRDHPGAAFLIRQMMMPRDYAALPVGDAADLMNGGSADLLLRISRADQDLSLVLALIAERNSLWAEAQEKFAAADYDGRSPMTEAEIRSTVGVRVFELMTNRTSALIREVEATEQAFSELVPALRKACVARYEDSRILSYERHPSPPTTKL